jgi:GDP-4-dehydro-6-deoxy-D-mannose reductase
MRILITGVSGFAGGHLAARLLRDGHDVRGTVRRHDSVARLLARLKGTSPMRADALTVLDIVSAPAVDRVVRDVRPDAVFHLAGTATVGGSEIDPASVFTTNALGTLHLLAAVRAHCPSARVVTVGSASAYGLLDDGAIPVTEGCRFRPVSPYGASKAAADLIAHQWAHAYDMDIVRVRPFNHIGPGQGLGFVCPDVAQQLVAIERGALPAVVRVGNIDVVRDFTDVRDVADGYVAGLERGVRADVYNVCSGVGRTIREMIDGMIEISGSAARLQVVPDRLRPADVPVAIGSAEKLERTSGWRPRIPLARSLADILDDWRTRAGAASV